MFRVSAAQFLKKLQVVKSSKIVKYQIKELKPKNKNKIQIKC